MEVALAVVVIIVGLTLGPLTRFFERRDARRLDLGWRSTREALSPAIMPRDAGVPPQPEPKGARVLICFAVIVIVFGLITLVRIWPSLRLNESDLYFWVWLILTMIFGMFVQVLATNFHGGRSLFAVEPSQLLFPLLFSIVVFYPIWGIGASAPRNFFSFYAAFLNGYFWETVVATTKPPAVPKAPDSGARP